MSFTWVQNFMFQYSYARIVEAKGKVDKAFEINSFSIKTSPQRCNYATILCNNMVELRIERGKIWEIKHAQGHPVMMGLR